MAKHYYVYIMASDKNGTLYVGSTSDLEGRIWEDKNKVDPKSFTAKYSIDKLVYYEELGSPDDMVAKERNLKGYKRLWKLNLINQSNPEWKDLSSDWY